MSIDENLRYGRMMRKFLIKGQSNKVNHCRRCKCWWWIAFIMP